MGILLLYIFPGKIFSQSIGEIKISGNFRNVPMATFFKTIESQYGVKSFYKDSWLEPYKINTSFDEIPLIKALNSIFTGHDLKYEFFQDHAIIIVPRVVDTRSKSEKSDQVLVIGDPINIGRYKTGKNYR